MLENIIKITKDRFGITDINSIGKDHGVWFLIGRNFDYEYRCLAINKTEDMYLDISCYADSLSKSMYPIKKVYRNYYGEAIFTYDDYGDCKKQALFREIRKNYDDLYFVHIKSEDLFINEKFYYNSVCKGAVIRFIGLNTPCTYWFNGDPTNGHECTEDFIQKKKENAARNLKDAINFLSDRANQDTLNNIKFFLDKLTSSEFTEFLNKIIFTGKPEWIQKLDTSINMIEDIQIYESSNGVRYSIVPYSRSKTDDLYDYVVYKGIEAPVMYDAETPKAVYILRKAFDPYLDDDGNIIEDVVIHCTQEHFKELMQVD